MQKSKIKIEIDLILEEKVSNIELSDVLQFDFITFEEKKVLKDDGITIYTEKSISFETGYFESESIEEAAIAIVERFNKIRDSYHKIKNSIKRSCVMVITKIYKKNRISIFFEGDLKKLIKNLDADIYIDDYIN